MSPTYFCYDYLYTLAFDVVSMMIIIIINPNISFYDLLCALSLVHLIWLLFSFILENRNGCCKASNPMQTCDKYLRQVIFHVYIPCVSLILQLTSSCNFSSLASDFSSVNLTPLILSLFSSILTSLDQEILCMYSCLAFS